MQSTLHRKNSIPILLAAALFLFFLAGCAAPTGQPTTNPVATPSSPPVETSLPATDTPTPAADQVVLWIPEDADVAAAQILRKTAAELASSTGHRSG